MAAALHFDLSVHNFGVQEYMRHTVETDKVFPHSYHFKDGWMHPGEKPARELRSTGAAQFPCRRVYLPVNRKLYGTNA
jgi:mannonate dehydratase